MAVQIDEGAKKGNSLFFNNHKDCAAFINAEACPGDLILIKGSRSSAMENVISNLDIS